MKDGYHCAAKSEEDDEALPSIYGSISHLKYKRLRKGKIISSKERRRFRGEGRKKRDETFIVLTFCLTKPMTPDKQSQRQDHGWSL